MTYPRRYETRLQPMHQERSKTRIAVAVAGLVAVAVLIAVGCWG
jgi:hypothetical protein